MKAAIYDINGPASVMRYTDVPDPVVGPNDVLIRVESISIEGGDLLGRRLMPPPRPAHCPGYQAAGVVVRRGEAVSRLAVGQRVVTFNWSGSHAELRAVPETFAYPVPDRLDIDVASTVPVTFGTADDGLFEFGRFKAGETVLIIGGAGGVGLAAIQLAKAAGAKMVIATASGSERAARLREFGADQDVDYKAVDLNAEVKRITGTEGVDLIFDLAGGPHAPSLPDLLRLADIPTKRPH